MIYAIVTSVLFFVLFIIWRHDDWLNLSLKIMFFGLFFWGLVASNAISLNLGG